MDRIEEIKDRLSMITGDSLSDLERIAYRGGYWAAAAADIAYLLDLIEPWVPVETLPEEEGNYQAWTPDGTWHDAWYQDGRFEDGPTGWVFDPQPTHYRRIKGPSPTLIKEDA